MLSLLLSIISHGRMVAHLDSLGSSRSQKYCKTNPSFFFGGRACLDLVFVFTRAWTINSLTLRTLIPWAEMKQTISNLPWSLAGRSQLNSTLVVAAVRSYGLTLTRILWLSHSISLFTNWLDWHCIKKNCRWTVHFSLYHFWFDWCLPKVPAFQLSPEGY